MKVVSGVYPTGSYEGQFFYNGDECRFHNIRESERWGIVIIHQELALIPHLSITENIFLANEQATRGVINWGLSHSGPSDCSRRWGWTNPRHPDHAGSASASSSWSRSPRRSPRTSTS